MIKRFYYEIEQHPSSMNHYVLPFLPPSTLRQAYLKTSSHSAPVAKLPLINHQTWSSFSHAKVLPVHTNDVGAVAFTPDGKHIISSTVWSIFIWDRNTSRIVRTLNGHQNTVNTIALLDDGKQIVSGSFDTTVQIWDFNSSTSSRTLRGHTDFVLTVGASRDGKLVASGSEDNMVRVWDVSNGECRHVLAGHSKGVKSVIFTPSGEQILSASKDLSIRVWTTVSGEHVRTLNGHTGIIQSIIITPTGDQIISASMDSTIRLWDLETGSPIRTLYAGSGPTTGSLFSLALSADGKRIAASPLDGKIHVWELSTMSLLDIHQTSFVQRGLALSPDGKQLLSGGGWGQVCLWDVPSHRPTPLTSVLFSDRQTIKATFSDGRIREWDVGTLSTGDIEAEGLLVPRRFAQTSRTYSYTITPHPVAWEGDYTHVGEVFETRGGEKRLACKVPLSIFWRGSKLIHSGRHVVLWHEDGHLLHLDFSSTPP